MEKVSTNTGSGSETNAQTINNVVLVHGAFADGSGYKPLYEVLTKQGYQLTVVQNPLTSGLAGFQ